MKPIRIYFLYFVFTYLNAGAQLNGVYTIGGTNPDYITINNALSGAALQGVSGPVIFNIRDGIYSEQLTIANIPGSTISNTITFQSESLDSTAVVIEYDGDTADNYVIKFDSASCITFMQLTIMATGNSNNVIEIDTGSSNISFLYCRIVGNAGQLVAATNNLTDSNNVFFSNVFVNGSDGLWISGSKNNKVINNIFNDQIVFSIFFNDANSPEIISNRIYSLITGINPGIRMGVEINNSTGGIKIADNFLVIKLDSTHGGGIGIDADGDTENRIQVYNNVVKILKDTSQSVVGIGGIGIRGSNIDVYNNSVKVSGEIGNGGLMSAFEIQGSFNCNILNNIFSNYSTSTYSYAVKVSGPSSGTLNYNDIYSHSPYLVNVNNSTYFPTLSDWQQTGNDTNSISLDPLFTDSLLHVSPYSPVCSRGIFLPELTEDIEGKVRKNPPSIGAYEIDSCEVSTPEITKKSEEWFSLYPSPANAELNIRINTEKHSCKIEIEIFNINGQKIVGRNFLNSNQSYRFNISGLSGGIYYCTVKNGAGYSTKRFLVMK